MLHAGSFISLINRPTIVGYKKIQLHLLMIFLATITPDYIKSNISRLNIYWYIWSFLIIHIDDGETDNSSEMHLTRRNQSQRNRLCFCNEIATLDWSSEYNEIDSQNAFSQFHTVLIKNLTSISQNRKSDCNTTLVNYGWLKDLKML